MKYSVAFFLYRTLIKACDAAVAVGSWYLCWVLRFDLVILPITKGLPEFQHYSKASLVLMLVFVAVFHIVGAYRHDRIHFGYKAVKKVAQGSFLGTLSFMALCYFLGTLTYSRYFLALFLGIVIVCLCAERAFLQFLWRITQRHLVRRIRMLLVGRGELLEMYVSQMEKRQPYPVEWVGRFGEPSIDKNLNSIPYLGDESKLIPTLESINVNHVIISYPDNAKYNYSKLLAQLSNELVSVKVIPDYGKFSTFAYNAAHECGIPLLQFNQSPMGSTDLFMKRVFDIVGSVLFMVVFSPLYLLLAILVKLTSEGPVIYRQRRVGVDGREFDCYKFRSMRIGAESKTGPVWASPEDDRTTWIGKWMRRTSLDEIPQFLNVLIGNMSIIGPRPERPHFVGKFRRQIPKYMLRHQMKSGLTGWAQVNGYRGNTSLEKRIKYDLYYVGHWSHRLDLKILSLTPWTLFKGYFQKVAY